MDTLCTTPSIMLLGDWFDLEFIYLSCSVLFFSAETLQLHVLATNSHFNHIDIQNFWILLSV